MQDGIRQFRKALKLAGPREVSVGYQTVYLYRLSVLRRRQVGYSRDLNGKSLISGRRGAWRDTWLVVGHDDLCGDPIFVDLSDLRFPVFTAPHGTNRWDPTLIAASFEQFLTGLKLVQSLSRGRTSPVALEEKPLTRTERAALRRGVRSLGSGIDAAFWLDWFEC